MAVGSIFEMFLTTFGWHLYDIVWGVISSTGLAYLPILSVIVNNIISPIQSQDSKSASMTSLRRLEIDIVRIILIMAIAVAPSFTLQYGSVSLTKACQGKTSNQGESGTVLDDIFNPALISGQEAKAPPLFYLVMSVTGGINDAIIAALPCEVSLRQTAQEVNASVITDPALRGELIQFTNECYKTANAQYLTDRKEHNAEVREDALWLGSQYLRQNHYVDIIAESPVHGFAFDPKREGDSSHVHPGMNVYPEWGYPNCEEWWSASDTGLRDRLVEEFPPSFYDRVNYLLQPDSLRAAEDAAIATLLSNDTRLKVAADTQEWTRYEVGGIGVPGPSLFTDFAAELVATGGGIIADILIQPVTFAVIKGAPLIQAVMLMSVYFLLPWILLFGNYEWRTVRTALVTVFAIKFWTSIWAVVSLLDNQLMKVIREASGNTGLLALTNDMILYKTLVDIAILSLYIGLPIFFMSMLSWSGEDKASQTNSTSSDLSGAGKQAGDTGANAASKGFSK